MDVLLTVGLSCCDVALGAVLGTMLGTILGAVSATRMSQHGNVGMLQSDGLTMQCALQLMIFYSHIRYSKCNIVLPDFVSCP